MKDGYILLLFVLGMFLVFTFSGQITGNPIFSSAMSQKQMSQKQINTGVLNILNKCQAIILEGNGNDVTMYNNKDCNYVCSYNLGTNSKCLLGFNTNLALKWSRITMCNGNLGTFDNTKEVICMCCSP